MRAKREQTKPPASAKAKPGKAVSVDVKPQAVAEEMLVPIALMRAAESVASKAEKTDEGRRGVLVHASEKGVGRVVGQDGFRLFIGAFSAPKAPSWLATGLLLVNDSLKVKLGMVATKGAHLILRYTKGASVAYIASMDESMVFTVPCAPVTNFPPYEKTLTESSFSDLTAEGELKSKREWNFVGFNSKHLKSCGEIAKILESGMAKQERDPDGMSIRISDGGKPNAPKVFDFIGYDGAVLVVAAVQITQPSLSLGTELILHGALKLTVAALRAHESRNRDWAAGAQDEGTRQVFIAKAEGFKVRVAGLLANAPRMQALDNPKPKPEADIAEGQPELTRAEKAAATRAAKAARTSAESEAPDAVMH